MSKDRHKNIDGKSEKAQGGFYSIEDNEMNSPDSYSVEDDKERNPSNVFYAATDDEDTPEEEVPCEKKQKETPFLQFLKLLGTPVEGWKAIKRSRYKPDRFAAECFYPLTGIAALSQFANIYFQDQTLSQAVTEGVVVFVSLFLTAFLMLPIARLFLPEGKRQALDTPFARKFVFAVMSSLSLFMAIYTLASPLQTVLVFLPMYSLYLTSRGIRFLRVANRKEMVITCVMCLLALGLPTLIYYLFYQMMPITQ